MIDPETWTTIMLLPLLWFPAFLIIGDRVLEYQTSYTSLDCYDTCYPTISRQIKDNCYCATKISWELQNKEN